MSGSSSTATVSVTRGNVDAKLKGRSELVPILEATSRMVSGDVHSPNQAPVSIPPPWMVMPWLLRARVERRSRNPSPREWKESLRRATVACGY